MDDTDLIDDADAPAFTDASLSPVEQACETVTADQELDQELVDLGITDLHQRLYLRYLSQTAHVTRSAKAAKVHRMTVLRWRERSPLFVEQEQRCLKAGTILLEEEIRRRAFEGVLEPVFYKGEHVGNVRKYSDSLAALYIRKFDHGYRDTVNVNVGADSLASALAAARARANGDQGA